MGEIAEDAARDQVHRLIQSKTFQTSEAHRRLLLYLADRTLAGDADRLKEYTVGLEAFGKPSTYDPKHDSIVRLQMGRLRQKLAVYYQSESNGDTVQVTLPKGGFKLVFESSETPSPVEPEAAGWPRRSLILLAALAVVTAWAVAATVVAVRASHQSAVVSGNWSPELEELWKPYLDSN